MVRKLVMEDRVDCVGYVGFWGNLAGEQIQRITTIGIGRTIVKNTFWTFLKNPTFSTYPTF